MARRAHRCDAETNERMASIDWTPDGRRLVTLWSCKRCGSQWCTIYDPEQAERDRLAALHARVAVIAAEGW